MIPNWNRWMDVLRNGNTGRLIWNEKKKTRKKTDRTWDGDGLRLNIAAAHGSFIPHMQIDPLSTPGIVPIDSLLSVNISIFFSISAVLCLCYSIDYEYDDNYLNSSIFLLPIFHFIEIA